MNDEAHLNGSRRWPSLLIGSLLTVSLIGGLVWAASGLRHSGPPARSLDVKAAGETVGSSSASALLVEDVTLVTDATTSSRAVGRASLAWSASTFPGIVKCSFAALAADGDRVGTYEDVFAILADAATIPVRIETSDTASKLTGQCGDRLDTGEPYGYQISNLAWTAQPDSVSLRFDAMWVGPAQAGAVSCLATAVDASGSEVGSKRFNLFILEGQASGVRGPVIATTSSAADVSVTCQPYE